MSSGSTSGANGLEAEIAGPVSTLSLSGSEDVAFVVDGGNTSSGEPRPSVHVVSFDGSVDRHELPMELPLFDVSSWWTGDRLAAVGLPCPAWTEQSGPPDIFEADGEFVAELCGEDEYIVGTWSPNSLEWEELPNLGMAADDGVSIIDALGPVAVIETVTAGAGDAPRYERDVDRSLVDVSTGTVEALPESPDLGGSADANFTTCLDADRQTVGLLSWEGPPPPGVSSGGWEEQSLQSEDPTSRTQTSYVALRRSGSDWLAVTFTGDVVSALSPECTPDGVLLASASRAQLIRIGETEVSITPIADLPESQSSTIVMSSAESTGSPIAIGLTDPAETRPDDPRSTPVWHLVDGEWLAGPDVSYGEGWSGLFVSSKIVSFVPGPGVSSLGEVSVDLR